MSEPADHSKKTLEVYGWDSVPHDQSLILENISPWYPATYDVTEIQIPETELTKKVLRYAQSHLPKQVFNHSMRVFYYGQPSSSLPNVPNLGET